jgi:hypothetical protein
MQRRTFIATVASVMATAAHADVSKGARAGHVRLSGWLHPVGHGPGHYFLLSPTPGGADPASADVRDWPAGFVRVFPSDARKMRAGKVSLTGRLYNGTFKDQVTGHAAGAVLVDAVLA